MVQPILRRADLIADTASVVHRVAVPADAPYAGEVAAEVRVPGALHARSKLLFCLPGGGVNRGYFDLDGFSFAAAILAAGHVVVLIDPPGVGESTRPDNGYVVTGAVIATALHAVLTTLRTGFPALPVIGVGHSAGAMLAILQQEAFGDFEALLLLCFGTAGLPQYFKPDIAARAADPAQRRDQLAELAAAQFGAPYLPPQPDARDNPAANALRRVLDHVVSTVAMQAMAPGNVAAELARIDVPILLAAGDRDMTGPPHLLPAACPGCPDLALHVVRSSGHHVFVSDAAPRLYRRIVAWLDTLKEPDDSPV